MSCFLRVEGVTVFRLGRFFVGVVRQRAGEYTPSFHYLMCGWTARGSTWTLGDAWIELKGPPAPTVQPRINARTLGSDAPQTLRSSR